MNLRIQQQQMQGHITPEMAMALRMPQNAARSASAQAQLMNSLSQPPALTSAHPGGIQPSHHQNNFQNSIPLPHQPQISSSPRPGSHSQSHTPSNMSMTPGPPQATTNRSQLTPDNAMLMNFQNQQFQQASHNAARLPANNSQFPFVPSSTPPNQHGDITQSMANALGNPPGSGTRPGFHLTPAQQFEQMQHSGEAFGGHFNMPPPQTNVPPRPPSHNNHHPSVTLPQQQQPQHHSPHQSDHIPSHIAHPQRPQSQPQAQPRRPPSQASPAHTPRVSQPPLPGSSGLGPSGRIPPLSQHGGPQPSHQSQPPAPGQPLPIAPRPQPPPSVPGPPAPTSSSAITSSEGGQSHSQISIPRHPTNVSVTLLSRVDTNL